MTDWYYIGHYGQIGPLTRDTMKDLIDTGVITRESFVWRTGMADWVAAGTLSEFSNDLSVAPMSTPPPPPSSPTAALMPPVSRAEGPSYPRAYGGQLPVYGQIRSDKSPVVAAILQFIPIGGLGRIYLGYTAIGVLQLISTFCFGIGYIWSLVDGVLMLCGQVKYDGYGRSLPE